MNELSLHILDIVQNSIVAKATHIKIIVTENSEKETLSIIIEDNGTGMTPKVLQSVTDPYTTSRTTRKVGMGLPLLNDACQLTGGCLRIESEFGKGTTVSAFLGLNHIDRQPMGDIAGVVVLMVSANPLIDFTYSHTINGNTYVFDTKEVKEVLEDIPLNTPQVIKMLREMIRLNLDEL
jgi:hypothetical protein